MGLLAIITGFGFAQTEFTQNLLDRFYFFVLAIGLISTFARYIQKFRLIRRRFSFRSDFCAFTLWIYYLYLFVGVPFKTDLMLDNPIWVELAVLLTFIREFSEMRIG